MGKENLSVHSCIGRLALIGTYVCRGLSGVKVVRSFRFGGGGQRGCADSVLYLRFERVQRIIIRGGRT